MRHHRRSPSLCLGLLAFVLTASAVAPVAGAVPGEHERRLDADVKPKSPPRAVAKTTTAGGLGATTADEAPGCRRLSALRPVKLNLRPETDIVDLVAWISSITCRQFLLPGTILGTPRKVTVYAPQIITAEGAYRLFLTALDSVGLTVQESGTFLRIIESAKAKNGALPLYGFEGQLLSNGDGRASAPGEAAAAPPSATDPSP